MLQDLASEPRALRADRHRRLALRPDTLDPATHRTEAADRDRAQLLLRVSHEASRRGPAVRTASVWVDWHADSQHGVGSSSTREDPMQAVPAPGRGASTPPQTAHEVDPAPAPTRDRPLDVLYVEDNPVDVRLMEAMLARPECGKVSLRSAPDGPQGLLMAQHKRPDLMLLDMNLPGLSGLELLLRMRTQPALADVRCVAVSARAMRQDIDTALAAGFDDYVTKPFALQRLAQMIQRYRTMAGGSG